MAIESMESRVMMSATAVGPEFPINDVTAGIQLGNAVGMDHSGNFVEVYTGLEPGSDGPDVYARLFDRNGVPKGDHFRVNTYTAANQTNAAVAMNDGGDFVVAWMSPGQDGSSQGIFAQRYDSQGRPQGGEFRVNTTTLGPQVFPTVAMDGHGGSIISFSSPDDVDFGIFAQRYDRRGAAVGGEFRVNTTTNDRQISSFAAMDRDGDSVITWTSFGQDGSFGGVFAQRFDRAGKPQGGEFQVNDFTDLGQRPNGAAMNDNGDFVIEFDGAGPESDGGALGRISIRGARSRAIRPGGRPNGNDLSFGETLKRGFVAAPLVASVPGDTPGGQFAEQALVVHREA